jgi:hypothetical protein
LRHGINANLVFGWRKDPRYNAALTRKPDFLPVSLAAPESVDPPELPGSASEIDITLRCGSRLICRGGG